MAFLGLFKKKGTKLFLRHSKGKYSREKGSLYIHLISTIVLKMCLGLFFMIYVLFFCDAEVWKDTKISAETPLCFWKDFCNRGFLTVTTFVPMTKIQITMAMLGKAKQVMKSGRNEDSGQTVKDVLD